MMEKSITDAQLLEQRLSQLFFELPLHLKGTYKTFQVMLDDNFFHRRDRTSNDVHAFFELHGGGYFHLRAYTRHMSQQIELAKRSAFLTGYLKNEISLDAGTHSLRQEWYEWNSNYIAQEILKQNQDKFLPSK